MEKSTLPCIALMLSLCYTQLPIEIIGGAVKLQKRFWLLVLNPFLSVQQKFCGVRSIKVKHTESDCGCTDLHDFTLSQTHFILFLEGCILHLFDLIYFAPSQNILGHCFYTFFSWLSSGCQAICRIWLASTIWHMYFAPQYFRTHSHRHQQQNSWEMFSSPL